MNEEKAANEDKTERKFVKPPIIHNIPQNPETTPIQVRTEESENTQNLQTRPQADENNTPGDEIITPVHEKSLKIVGTAHISDESIKSVKEVIYEKRPEIVAIELDTGRYRTLIDEANGVKKDEKLDLKTFLKSSNITVTIVTVLLSHMQSKMGEEVGVKPGSEMLEAIKLAEEVNADIALIDRNIQVTLKRTLDGMKFTEKLSFLFELVKSLFMKQEDTDEFKEEIEDLKDDEILREAMNMFREASPGGFNALVHERDAYMAYYLKSLEDKNVVAVVGAGHQPGIKEYLANPETIPSIESINHIKESKISPGKIIVYLIPAIFILIFIFAYFNGINIQGGIVNYLIFAGGGAFIGSLLSGSRIQSAIVGMIAAPVTTIHPLLASGWFSGLVEGKLRGVGFDDLTALPECDSFSELWHNKLFRVIIVVIGTNIGTTIGVLCIISNVFIPYLHTILGI